MRKFVESVFATMVISTGGRKLPGVVRRSFPVSTIPSALTIASREIRAATCWPKAFAGKNNRRKPTSCKMNDFIMEKAGRCYCHRGLCAEHPFSRIHHDVAAKPGQRILSWIVGFNQ